MSKWGRSYGLCVLFVVVGAILGGILGELMKGLDAFQGLVETEYTMKTGQGLKEIQFELFLIRYANAMPKQ